MGPSIEALDRCWGAHWRVGSEAMFYGRLRRVIREIQDSTARDDRQAIDQLEKLRGKHSLDGFASMSDRPPYGVFFFFSFFRYIYI